MVAAGVSADIEGAFRQAYARRHGHPVREFRPLGNGSYLINGIQFSSIEVDAMLRTLESEIAKRNNQGLIKRLIRHFGGKTL